MAKAVGAEAMYGTFYRFASSAVHTDPIALLKATKLPTETEIVKPLSIWVDMGVTSYAMIVDILCQVTGDPLRSDLLEAKTRVSEEASSIYSESSPSA